MGKVIQFPKIPRFKTQRPISKKQLLALVDSAMDINAVLQKRADSIKSMPIPESDSYLLSIYLDLAAIQMDWLLKISPHIDISKSDIPMYSNAIGNQFEGKKLGLDLDIQYLQKLMTSIVREMHNLVLKVADDE